MEIRYRLVPAARHVQLLSEEVLSMPFFAFKLTEIWGSGLSRRCVMFNRSSRDLGPSFGVPKDAWHPNALAC